MMRKKAWPRFTASSTPCSPTAQGGRSNSFSSMTGVATVRGPSSPPWPARDQRVRAIRFRRNFGKAAALTAGFQAARGEQVFTLDGDLQDDPAEIPRFLAELEKGYDVVSGWKKTRHDPWHKVYPSRVFNWMVSRVSGCRLHDHNCGFKLYKARWCGRLASMVSCTGSFRFWLTPAAFGRRGRGSPSEPAPRRIQVWLLAVFQGVSRPADGPLSDPIRPAPLACAGWHRPVAFGPGKPGHALSGRALARSDATGRSASGRCCSTRSRFLVVGVQLLSLGVLAELVTAYNIRAEDTYSVAETIPAQGKPGLA